MSFIYHSYSQKLLITSCHDSMHVEALYIRHCYFVETEDSTESERVH